MRRVLVQESGEVVRLGHDGGGTPATRSSESLKLSFGESDIRRPVCVPERGRRRARVRARLSNDFCPRREMRGETEVVAEAVNLEDVTGILRVRGEVRPSEEECTPLKEEVAAPHHPDQPSLASRFRTAGMRV